MNIDNPIHVFSFGGGVQSNAVLALAASGVIRVDAFIFANVGDDSENPATIEYVNNVSKPFAERHGLAFIEVQAQHKGEPDTLLKAIHRRSRAVPIPAVPEDGGPLMRNCTVDFKIEVINRYLKRVYPGGHVRVGIGFSTDEWQRARDTDWHNAHGGPDGQRVKMGYWRQNWYPLLDLRHSRNACHRIIQDAGLPIAPKSSCYFCPFHRRGEWVEMKAREPELFERACQVDDLIRERTLKLRGRGSYIHPDRKPLRDAVANQQMLFDDADGDDCSIGHCLT